MTSYRAILALAAAVSLLLTATSSGSAHTVSTLNPTGNGTPIWLDQIGIPISPVYTIIQPDNGTTVAVAVGQSVALSLSAQMNWSVSVSNQTVLVPASGPLPAGDQGLWQAAMAGQSVVTADGRPVCNSGQLCAQFIVHFQATVDVSGGGSPLTRGTAVSYAAGWNLVAGPAGATFPVPLYAWDPVAGQFDALAAGQPLQAGDGYWANFDQPTSVPFPPGAPSSVTVPLPAGAWVLIGNPSATASAAVSGADAVYTYNATLGTYTQSNTLPPGEGGWAYARAGGNAQIVSAAAP